MTDTTSPVALPAPTAPLALPPPVDAFEEMLRYDAEHPLPPQAPMTPEEELEYEHYIYVFEARTALDCY